MREIIEANYYNEDLKKRYINEKEKSLAITSNYIDVQFRKISEVEAFHESRYLRLLVRVETGQVFERDEEIEWQCRNCGYVHKGKSAPKACPACVHPQAYFEPKRDNY